MKLKYLHVLDKRFCSIYYLHAIKQNMLILKPSVIVETGLWPTMCSPMRKGERADLNRSTTSTDVYRYMQTLV